jgi:hypothetical protein
MHKKPIIISDLDGTLADVRHRRHLVAKVVCPLCEGDPKGMPKCPKCKGKGTYKRSHWNEFQLACVDDTLFIETLTVIKALQEAINAELWIVSARDAAVKPQTIWWLGKNHVVPDQLIMRPEGDTRPDDVLKESWVHSGVIPINRVFCVFDDRNKVVAMWREKFNLQVYQCADGDF